MSTAITGRFDQMSNIFNEGYVWLGGIPFEPVINSLNERDVRLDPITIDVTSNTMNSS
jgi:hypothetical protein